MTTERLLACGVVAGPLFTVAYLVAGATRAHYDPLRHPVSALALGDGGWMQTANFVAAGLLMLAYASGARRALRAAGGSRWGSRLVGAYAVGLLGAGLFAADPLSGYPPGTADRLVHSSVQGALHQLFSALVFVGLPILCLVFARRFAARGERAWAAYSVTTCVVFMVAFVLASVAFSQAASLVAYGGLFQRIALSVGWAWLTLLAIRLRRGAPA